MAPLQALLFDQMLKHAAPGNTGFSLEPACVATAAECPGAKRSSFYGGMWMKRETAERGRERYHGIAEAIVEATDRTLCTGAFAVESCVPWRHEKGPATKSSFSRQELAQLLLATAIIESGLREDVHVGRGWSKKADDAGGRGRGPGFEACLMQIHPTVFERFVPEYGKTRNEIADAMLGMDRESTVRCFVAGARMLVHARRFCAWRAPHAPIVWASIALYVSGNTCSTPAYSTVDNRAEVRYRTYLALKSGKAPPKAASHTRRAVLLGDSHAEGLIHDLRVQANRRGWRVGIEAKRGTTALGFQGGQGVRAGDLALVSLGTNDCHSERGRKKLEESLEATRARFDRVVFLEPPNACSELLEALPDDRVPLPDGVALAKDGIHVTAQGARAWASAIAERVFAE